MSISVEEFAALQTQFLDLKNQNFELKEKEKKLAAELEKSKEELKKSSGSSINKFAESITKGKKTKEEVENLKKENQQLQFQLEQANRENKEQQNALRANIKSIYESNEQIQNELDKYKVMVKEFEKKQVLSENSDLIPRLQDQISELKKQEEHHKKQIEILTSSLKSAAHGESSNQNSDAPSSPKFGIDIETIKKQLESQSNGDVGHSDGDKEAVLKIVQSTFEQQVEQISKEIEKKVSASHLDKIQEMQQQMKKTEEDYSQRVNTLNEQIQSLQEKNKQLQTSMIQLEEKTTKDITEKDEKSKVVITRKEEQLATLHAQLKQKSEEMTKLEADVNRFKEELSVVQEDRAHFIKKFTDKNLEVDGYKDQITFHKDAAEKAKAQADQFQEALQKERENFTTNLKQRVEAIGKLNQELNEKNARITDLEAQLSAFKSTQTEVSQQNKELYKKFADLEESANSSGKEVKTLQDTINELKNKLSTSETTSKAAEEKLEAATKELIATRTKLTLLNESANILEGNLDKMRQNWMQAKQSSESLTTELETKTKEIENLQEQINVKEKEKVRLSKKLDKHKAHFETKIKELEERTQLAVAKEKEYFEKLSGVEDQMKVLADEKKALENEIEDLKKQFQEKETELNTKLEEANKKITELETTIKDKETEILLVDKTNKQKNKQLSEQIVKDRKSFEKQIRELQSQIGQEHMKPHPYGAPSTPDKGMKRSSSSSQVDRVPLTPTPLPQPKMDVTLEVLQNEINQLIAVRGEMQNEKWTLEEKVRTLEETVGLMGKDIERKETIIKSYALDQKVGRSTPEMDALKLEKKRQNSGVFGIFGGNKDLTQELTQRMEAVLEDTLLKNIQLQNDLKIMGDEVTKLMEENKALKAKV